MENQAALANKPFRVQMVRGEAYEVMGRSLIPVARITSLGRARATVGRDRVQGWAGGFSQVVPLAVIEEGAEGEQYIAIGDATQNALRRILAMALVMTVMFAMLRRLAQACRERCE